MDRQNATCETEPSAAAPTVSVVVLSYNRPALLRRALASVLAQTFDEVEVIVVDNASPSSEEVARVVGERPGVRLIRNATNLGYAGGMNRGIERASGRYVYLTEDDILLDRDCVRRLVEHMEASPETGVCSPVMYNEAAGTIRCAGGALRLGGVYRRETFGEGEPDTGQYARPFEVNYVDGAVVFARADFLRSLGGFREEFFMYVEAVEFSARVAKAGRKMFVVPAAKVYHFEPAAEIAPRADLEFHKRKNLYALYLLHAPARVLPEFFLRYAVAAPLRAMPARPAMVWPLVKAWGWFLLRAPSFVMERRAAARRSNAARRPALGAARRAVGAARTAAAAPISDAPARVVFVNVSESRTENFKRELARRGWEVEELTCGSWREAAGGLSGFMRAARRSRFILTGTAFPWQGLWMSAARAAGLKVVVDCPMDITAAPFPSARRWRWPVRFFCRRADLFLTLASREYTVAEYGLEASKVLLLESCPDLERIGRAAAAEPRVRRAPGTVLVGYSGVAPWQRAGRFLPVFKALLERVPEARWLVVSQLDRPEVEALRRGANEAGLADRVEFSPVIKPVEDFYATMAQCDLWVGHLGDDTKQGRHELRMELLEMAALGVPVALVKTPALERHGLRDGVHFVHIDPEDAEGSAARLAVYLADAEGLKRVGAALQKHVLENFSLERSVDRLLEAVGAEGRRAGRESRPETMLAGVRLDET